MKTLLTFSLTFLLVGCKTAQDSPQFPAGAPPEARAVPLYDPSTATSRIAGSITFLGTPPEMPLIRPGGTLFCVRNAKGMRSQEVLVTADGKLQNVIVYVRSGHQGRSYSAPTEPVLLDQQRCVYTPHVFTIMTNQKLRIRNSDDTFHNVRAKTEVNTPFNLGQPVIGAENTEIFTHPEVPARIGCDMHPWMATYAGVFDHPFHTTSGNTGSYELRLPPGKYEIVAWHEKYGEKTMTVEVAGNSTVELNFTFAEKPTAD